MNNAGIETIIPFTELTDEEWDRVTSMNLKSEWMGSQSFCESSSRMEPRDPSLISDPFKRRESFRAGRTTRPASSPWKA